MSKKQIVQEEVKYPLDWTYGVSLEQLEKDIAVLKKLGVEEVYIEPDEMPYGGGATVNIRAYIHREETDQEMKERLDKLKATQKRAEEQELAMLKKLKEKYKDK